MKIQKKLNLKLNLIKKKTITFDKELKIKI